MLLYRKDKNKEKEARMAHLWKTYDASALLLLFTLGLRNQLKYAEKVARWQNG